MNAFASLPSRSHLSCRKAVLSLLKSISVVVWIGMFGVPSALGQETAGTFKRVAGGALRPEGACGAALQISLNNILSIAVDDNGNLFIGEAARIRKLDTEGRMTFVAGTGTVGFSGDNGPAIDAMIHWPYDLLFDRSGNLIFSDSANNRIRKIDTNGIITTLAGTGANSSFFQDGERAKEAMLYSPTSLAMNPEGHLLFLETGSSRIARIDDQGILSAVALARQDHLGTHHTSQITVDRQGQIYLVSGGLYKKVGNEFTELISPNKPMGDVVFDTKGALYVLRLPELYYPSFIDKMQEGEVPQRIIGISCLIRRMNPFDPLPLCDNVEEGPVERMLLLANRGLALNARGELFVAGRNNVYKINGVAAPGLLAGVPFPEKGTPPIPSQPCMDRPDGDVNADSSVDVKDAILTLQFALNLNTGWPGTRWRGDLDLSGKLDVRDAISVLIKAVFPEAPAEP